MPGRNQIVDKGRVYYSVEATARLLSTTTTKVRGLMDRGDLEWTQLRVNGRILIPAESIVRYLKRQDVKPG